MKLAIRLRKFSSTKYSNYEWLIWRQHHIDYNNHDSDNTLSLVKLFEILLLDTHTL